MRLVLILIWTIVASLMETSTFAMCGRDKYVLTGRIMDCQSGTPLQNATIFAFLDAYERAHGPMTLKPFEESWVSFADGRFEITTYFDRLKQEGRVVDDCSKIATSLELFIVKAGYYTTRKRFSKVKIVVRGKNHKSIELPEICMESRARP